MTQEINIVIKALDKNIEILEGVNKLKDEDVVMLFLELFGTLKDMWERFEVVFDKVKELKKVESEEYNYNDIKDEDIQRLYQ